MLTEEVGAPIIRINQSGAIIIDRIVVIKKNGEEINSYRSSITIENSDDPVSEEQIAALPEVKARLAAAQGVVTKKEKPNKPAK